MGNRLSLAIFVSSFRISNWPLDRPKKYAFPSDAEFLKFNHAYKKKLDQVIKEKKLTDLFSQVDEALKRVKDDDACRNVRRS